MASILKRMSIVVKENISLKPYTVFKIGGNARFFVEVKSTEELKEALSFAKGNGVPFFVAGAGSNILVSDKGFDGLYIKNLATRSSVDGSNLFCESGVMMPYASLMAAKTGLTGLEWGIGIPGTVGGSVRGNAGCFGGETKNIVRSVDVFDANDGTVKTFLNNDCKFSYRDSAFKKNYSLIVLSAVLGLNEGKADDINKYMRELAEKRATSQNVGAKCAGCIFKNISWDRKDINKAALIVKFPLLKAFEAFSGISAGFLIDESGLKGRRIGGATISRRHANFFVNTFEATAEDVVMLIAIAKEYVHRKFGILLEEEIQYVGF
ncbi:MAG: UDP-N-acetylmuramate dehydrogenase [bacterium]|nr:UDP-N-acetylmuramate dehydrogenase [bacterium]